MSRTKRGLKKSHSEKAAALKQTRFTVIVNKQDGKCWYCGEKMGADCTREHLLSQSAGGTNTYPVNNLKASHSDCNIAAGHLPIKQKYRLRVIAHTKGREEMFRIALQMRRENTRIAFSVQKDEILNY
mgnify:FL=1